MKKIFVIATLICLAIPSLFSQNVQWNIVEKSDLEHLDVQRQIYPKAYTSYAVNFDQLFDHIQSAPERAVEKSFVGAISLDVPFPDGTIHQFMVMQASVMSPLLSEKFPEILAFVGLDREDKTTMLRGSIGPKGFHGLILSGSHPTIYIDPYGLGDHSHHISYYKKDFVRGKSQKIECEVVGEEFVKTIEVESENQTTTSSSTITPAGDCMFRTYRLALACTGEYATFHGGTVPDVMEAFNTAMARVNGVYERDAGLTMVLVDDNDQLIYLNGTTDPYTNNNGGTMLGQNQTTCNDVIGFANYDIGHVFSTGGGGIANLQAPCGNNKAQGVTGLGSPIGDPFTIDYVSHEMGHQYGGNHTQNNNCNRVNATAWEPGSASTIMGYAGICAPNVQNNSDDHFHAGSIGEISNFIVNGNGANCPVTEDLGNSKPDINVQQSSYNVPGNTPFMLTCDASDVDGDSLTYCWEQMDNAIGTMPPSPTNAVGPMFRSNSPTPLPTRFFPNLGAILDNINPQWEVLASVTRDMNFRCTVRDNNPIVGCTNEENVTVQVDGGSGPFLVIYPNGGELWNSGTTETVTWDVANTDVNPVNCANVDILLSLDGGTTYPVTLATAVTNDGSHDIIVPAEKTDLARVMILCSDNIFFDVSDENFEITAPFSMLFEADDVVVCGESFEAVDITIESFNGFSEDITFSAANVPAGMSVNFTTNPVSPPGMTTMELNDLDNLAVGFYSIDIIGTTLTEQVQKTITISVPNQDPSDFDLMLPENGEQGTVPNPTFTWDALPGVLNYQIEISTDPGFNIVTQSSTINTNSYTASPALDGQTVYYWRVKASSLCAEGDFVGTYSFKIGGLDCEQFLSVDIPIDIPEDATGVVGSELELTQTSNVGAMKVFAKVDHTWVGDLNIELTSPSGTIRRLMAQPGVPDSQYGCDADNIDVVFDDFSDMTADDLENACGANPAISGSFQPTESLGAFNGEPYLGTWILEVEDFFAEDGGAITEWGIEVCESVSSAPAIILKNEYLIVANSAVGFVDQAHLETEDSDPAMVSYRLLTLPIEGTMFSTDGINSFEMTVGEFFSQDDVNTNKIYYEHDGGTASFDHFDFDVTDSQGRWLPNQVFNILILQGDIGGVPQVATPVSCFGDSDGSISVIPFGGNAPYTYSLDGSTYQMDSIFTGLAPDTYTIFVQDTDGLVSQLDDITLTEPVQLEGDLTVDNYTITIDAMGGTPGLEYSLDGGSFQGSNIFDPVANGDYTITVRDANGCEITIDATVDVFALSGSLMIVEEISCANAEDGIIMAEANGGAGPFSYSIDGTNFQSSPEFSNLSFGMYTVTILDIGLMEATTNTVDLVAPPAIIGSADANGETITVDASGGAGGFTYSIDGGANFQMSNEFITSNPGMYTIIIRDADGCEIEVNVIVNFITEVNIDISPIICNGDANASVDVTDVINGVGPYTYSFDGSPFTTQTLYTDLAPGSYELQVKDANDYIFTLSNIDITDPAILSFSVDVVNDDMTINATGGYPAYMYSIDGGTNFQASNMFIDQASGDYDVVVTDEEGCMSAGEAMISNVDDVSIDNPFFVSPNPGPGLFKLSFEQSVSTDLDIYIYNDLGQLIKKRKWEASTNQEYILDLQDLSGGAYLLNVRAKDIHVVKVIIKI